MGKSYTVTLEEEVVGEAKEELKKIGAKLSPTINILLKKWTAEQKGGEE